MNNPPSSHLAAEVRSCPSASTHDPRSMTLPVARGMTFAWRARRRQPLTRFLAGSLPFSLLTDNLETNYLGYAGSMSTSLPERTDLDLSFLLAHTSHVLATRMTAAFAEIGMTPRGHCVLMKAMPGGLTQIELAKLADLDKTTMVVTLDELEAGGYAERRLSPADRRARIITVTEAGRRIAAAGQRVADRVHREVLDTLPAGEREAFASALVRLAAGYLASPVDCERPVRRPRQSRN
jgi:MarR family transcriptional regulator for hemolysin